MADTLTTRLAVGSDVEMLHKIIHWAYRGGGPGKGWTGEEDLIEGPRISITALAEEVEANSALAEAHAIILVAVDEGMDAEVVAERGSDVVGCIKVEKLDGGNAEVGLFAVDPSLQSRGAGSLLLGKAEQHAFGVYDVDETVIHVLSPRTDILAWYGRKGYSPNGNTLPFPPPGTSEDDVGAPRPRDGADLHFIELVKSPTSEASA